jgi:cytochrome c oxidase assembly factor CtaG
MYDFALWLHSLLRWAVLVTGLVTWFRAIGGKTASRTWTPQDELWTLLLMISADLQLLAGLVLYFALSPITKLAFSNFGAAMRIEATRFFTVEHPAVMIIAIALIHVARVRIRRTKEPSRKHRVALVLFGIAMVLIIIGTPWPFMPPPFVSRPLLHP